MAETEIAQLPSFFMFSDGAILWRHLKICQKVLERELFHNILIDEWSSEARI